MKFVPLTAYSTFTFLPLPVPVAAEMTVLGLTFWIRDSPTTKQTRP